MNQDLFLAILAMDAYNRGYGAGIANLGAEGSWLGEAKIIRQSDVDPNTPGVTAGFYAVAYEWTPKGEPTKTVISYRGTDNPLGGDPTKKGGSDLLNGWLIGAGFPVSQAWLAEQFYKTVTGQTGSYPTNAPNLFLN
jgi:hypothetical protein